MKRRELIMVGGGHRKFWTVETSGGTMTCTWGRMGTAGQTKSWSYGSAANAEDVARSKIQEKLAKGYVDHSANSGNAAAKAPGPPDVTTEEMAAARSTLENVMADLEDG